MRETRRLWISRTRPRKAPSALTARDYDAFATWFDETKVTEMPLIVCQMRFFNRWNDSVATQLESKPLRFSKDTRPQSHWQAGKHE